MIFHYTPQGVCSRAMDIEVEGDRIVNVSITDGCSGSLQGISRLLVGMPLADAISRLKGIRCGRKKTSCPDQLSIALESILNSRV